MYYFIIEKEIAEADASKNGTIEVSLSHAVEKIVMHFLQLFKLIPIIL